MRKKKAKIKIVFDIVSPDEENNEYFVKQGFETRKDAEDYARNWEKQTWGKWGIRQRKIVVEC